VMEQVLPQPVESSASQTILLYLPQVSSYHSQPSFDNEKNLPWRELQHSFFVLLHVLPALHVVPLFDAVFLPVLHGAASLAIHASQPLLLQQLYVSHLQFASPRFELVSFLQQL